MPPSGASGSSLPPLYDRWVTELLGVQAPAEPLATCEDCAMCGAGTVTRPGGRIDLPVAFDPDARCCTYQPAIWNFLAGAALADRSRQGAVARESILARLSNGDGVTPLGLERSRRYAALYESGAAGFGLAHSLRCPHYIEAGARCAIWQHRESTCATWFCKHEHGAVSKRFWDRLHAVLRASELAVARHAVLELGIEADALAALVPIATARPRSLSAAEVDGIADPVRHRRVWGDWTGREAEFYERAAALAAALPWAAIRRLGGSDLEVHLALLLETHRELSVQAPPDRLRLRSYSVAFADARARDTVLLETYSGIDPLEVPARLLACLPYFDGRSTSEALDAIEGDLGMQLDVALVRKLYEFGVLESTESPSD